MFKDWVVGLGIITFIFIIFCIVAISILIATTISNLFGFSGILWWIVTIFVIFLIWGILGKLC